MEEEILRIVTEEKSKREKLEADVKKLSSEVISSKAFFDEMDAFHKGREKHLEDQVSSSKDQIAEMSKVIESDISTKKYRELIKGSYEDSVNDIKALFQAEKEVLVGKVEGLQLEIEVFIEEIETLKVEKAKHNDEIQEKAEIIEKIRKRYGIDPTKP
jgi:predicted nuclease with TOPRIM domain